MNWGRLLNGCLVAAALALVSAVLAAGPGGPEPLA